MLFERRRRELKKGPRPRPRPRPRPTRRCDLVSLTLSVSPRGQHRTPWLAFDTEGRRTAGGCAQQRRVVRTPPGTGPLVDGQVGGVLGARGQAASVFASSFDGSPGTHCWLARMLPPHLRLRRLCRHRCGRRTLSGRHQQRYWYGRTLDRLRIGRRPQVPRVVPDRGAVSTSPHRSRPPQEGSHVGEVTHYPDRPTYDRAVLQWFGEFWLLRDDPLARLDPMKS